MSETISQPHDAFFRAIFGRVAHAASLFQQLLPRDVVERLDWSELRWVDGSFVDKDFI